MGQPVITPTGLLLFFINETGAELQMGHFPRVLSADVNRGDSLFCVTESVWLSSLFLCWRECSNNAAILPVLPVFVPLFPESFLPTCLLPLCLLAYLPPALPF